MFTISLHAKRIAAAILVLAFAPGIAMAENIRTESQLPVAQAVERLSAAIGKAGARVFATVDYQAGAASVGETIRPTTVVIFGSPKIGADAFRINQAIGLYLPLRVLAYEDEAGKVWLVHGDPADAAADYGIPGDHSAIKSMQGALAKLTAIAAGS